MAHALARGFMTTTKGTPDESRSARVILKDVVNAKLLYTTPPPPSAAATAAAAAASGDSSSCSASGRKLPAAPTTSRWLEQMKNEYEAQAGISAHYTSTGHKGRAKGERARVQAMRAMQWRPTSESALPDRLVAKGQKVEIDIE